MKKLLALFIIGMLFLNHTSAQNGKYVVSTSLESIDCEAQKAYIDIRIKAATEGTTFMLADQNYRLSFSSSALVPGSVTLEKELEVSGMTTSESGMAIFGPHSLNGTDDTIVSYNIELIGGVGYPISSDKWTSIGRLGFDIEDTDECFSLKWHDNETFPPTYVSEQWDGLPQGITSGEYQNLDVCLPDHCSLTTSTDVVEAQSAFMKIQPTVTKSTIILAYTGEQSISANEIIVSDMAGNLMQNFQTSPYNKNEFVLDVSHFPQGIYAVSIQGTKAWTTQKFVKM